MINWINHVKDYQAKNGCSYREALSKAGAAYNRGEVKGGSIKSIGKDIKKTFNRTTKAITKGVNQTVNTIDDVYQKIFNGRIELSPKVKLAIKNNGDAIINSIEIWRNPVQSLMVSALNGLSLGKFGNRFEKEDYNTMFHLGLAIKLSNGRTILLEKNEIINTEINPKKKQGTEVMPITSIPADLTLFELLDNAMKRVGERKLLVYSARDSNCQDFAIALLQSSGIANAENTGFVKQDTKHLFNKLTNLRKITNTATDLGRYVQVVAQGGSLQGKKKRPIY
jgi:hypothetical protein